MTTNDLGEALQEGFEGPEKRLEIQFERDPGASSASMFKASPMGLRSYNRDQWQSLLKSTACTILSVTSNQNWDAYLLSESSLFVSVNRVVLKTCGRTILLRGVDEIVKYGQQVGMRVSRVIYCRKNYTFPHRQLYPHRSFAEEVSYLDERFTDGKSFVVGPQNTDHWLLYVAKPGSAPSDKFTLLEIKMHELDPEVMGMFFSPEGERDAEQTSRVTNDSGIQSIIPSMNIDGFLFEPCGYSMNGLSDKAYSTIHITPESHCSYVSYEAFLDADTASSEYITELTARALSVFRPASFTCTCLTSDDVVQVSSILSSSISAYCSKLGNFEHIYTSSGSVGESLSIHTDMIAVLPPAHTSSPQHVQSMKRLFVMSRVHQPMPQDCTYLPVNATVAASSVGSDEGMEFFDEPLPVFS